MEEKVDPMIPEITCVRKKEGLLICKNKECKHPAIMCYNKKCQCKASHQKCSNLQLQPIVESLISSKKQLSKNASDSFDQIEKSINGLIQKLSDVRESILKGKQTYGLNKNCQLFYFSLMNQQFEKITGQVVSQSQEELLKKQQTKILSLNQVKDFWKQQLPKFQQFCSRIKSLTQNSHFKIINHSKITKDFKQLSTWIEPSIKKKITDFKLLYRASQNGFQVSEFHKKCDNIKNTLILCQTQFGKIIGGFNAYTWNNGAQVDDNQNTCFIFSINQRAKIPLCNGGVKAIVCCNTDGPNFGADNFTICNQANTNNHVYCTAFGTVYSDGTFQKNQSTYEKFIGNKTGQCKAKQWEVYQVV